MMKKWLTIISLISVFGCGGADHALVYFPPPPEATDTPAQPSIGAERAACTIIFTSQLCVMLKGDNVDVGTNPEDPLCVEVDPFPLHISGTTITMDGSEFPDVPFEGHGLPAPIMINGKGEGTGKENVGSGTIDGAGNIAIENFSIFINALSLSAEIPDLTLTTGTTSELPDLPALTGKVPDPSGAMTLVTGTVLGSLFEAADEVLMGASLTASFTGAIEPTLSSCSGSQGERSVEVTKIAIDTNGAQTETSIPEGKRMEVSNGTYIADTPDDVGPSYEATTTFRVTNTSSKSIALKLSPQVGSFFLDSLDPLTRTLEPQQSFLLKVTFRPRAGVVEPGEVHESIMIGQDLFELTSIAREAGGTAEVDVVADDGSIAAGDVDTVDMGEMGVAATMERGFFSCQKVMCGNHDTFTGCTPCSDPTTEACELLPLANSGKPFGEVDAQCALLRPDDIPLFTIDLQGTAAMTIPGGRKVMALRNRGVTDLVIESVSIDHGEFQIPEGGITLADSLATVAAAEPTALPLTLPPFQPGVRETTAYILIVYQPRDLQGSQGDVAGVGSAATDRAVLT
ncbi:MAG: hypothetical protein HY465_00085, partial [Deltaproteobacteria bacterium]|nr:hypothetical protein [Deltaproteobacteria bacterium]